MRRRLILLAASTMLLACSPPANDTAKTEPAPAPTPPPVQAACNALTPDMTKPVRLTDQAVAAAALQPELPGGPITPGVYDLTAGNVLDGAPGWTEDHFVALEVTESAEGVTFNFADARMGGETRRYTADFTQGPPAQLTFTCGANGPAPIDFAAEPNRLGLRMPGESGTGRQYLIFTRRG